MSQSYAKSPAAERKFTTREMVLVGMFAAVLAVISQISLPMSTGVPVTIQVFGVALVGAVLGSRLGTTATLVYVLLGAIGLLIVETIGGLQWHFVGGSMSIPAIAVYSLTAFIPKDIVITVLAVLIAIPIRKGINISRIMTNLVVSADIFQKVTAVMQARRCLAV